MENLNELEKDLLKQITDTDDYSGGAFNIRKNGKKYGILKNAKTLEKQTAKQQSYRNKVLSHRCRER